LFSRGLTFKITLKFGAKIGDQFVTYDSIIIIISFRSVIVEPISLHRTNELNPHCDLGACGVGRWALVMKIDGSEVTTHYANNIPAKNNNK